LTDELVDGVLPASAIRDADAGGAPPEIRTWAGGILFVSAEHSQVVAAFCRANEIPVRRRPDVWGDLLEPFLDTEFGPEHQAATLRRLAQIGLDAGDVLQIREKVGPIMRAYNAVHWDWCHLGLADLLDAATATWIPEELRTGLGELAHLCSWGVDIANRADR
jgi:hypothetical protein